MDGKRFPPFFLHSPAHCRALSSFSATKLVIVCESSSPFSFLTATLSRPQNHRIVFESAWALTNVLAGNSEETKAVLEAGVVPVFVQLLEHPSVEVVEQAVRWKKPEPHGPSQPAFFLSQRRVRFRLKRCGAWATFAATAPSTVTTSCLMVSLTTSLTSCREVSSEAEIRGKKGALAFCVPLFNQHTSLSPRFKTPTASRCCAMPHGH